MECDSVLKRASWVCIFLLFFGCELVKCSVSYDKRALIIDGQRRILFSGSIHYPRSAPDMWEDIINNAKEGGLDVVDTYVFWNVHEPSQGTYNFEGGYDLVRFVKTIQKAGLYAHLRIGPYVCAEWNFGGFPVWLKYVPGISFRTDNEPFKMAMKGFVEKIVGMMKSENLYASQGGPIILSQIENEYGPLGKQYGAPGREYVNWAANMAVNLDTGVPWVMCKEDDAPDPVINTCNGFYCDAFTPNQQYKPMIWTEAWTGWFSVFGTPSPRRPAEDLAFSVAKFVQNGGSFVNYYMYHGGTNFGRSAGGPFITTSYDYDAPIDEYGLLRQPKHGHLKQLHNAIKLCETALVSAEPTVISLGSLQQAHVYSNSGVCAAFLANNDANSAAEVVFNNVRYELPAWSVSILPDCRNVVFNTAQVGVQTSRAEMGPTNTEISSWETYNEDLASYGDSSAFSTMGLLEQINVTRDTSDYLWYSTSVDIDSSEKFLHGGNLPTLTVHSTGHALNVFVNGELSGYAFGTRERRTFTFQGGVSLRAGSNTITLLSVAVGLPNVGGHFEIWSTGILGPVALHGLDEGKRDLTWAKWTYRVGLKGEALNLASPDGVSSVDWMSASLTAQQQRLVWFKGHFNAPDGDEPLALDMSSMGKGQVWVNGQSLGRYWTVYAAGNCGDCVYSGSFRPPKCQIGCGQPTQKWYHLPRSWLKPAGNMVVLFEELGGDPTKISLVKRSITGVCADVSEYHPTMENWKTPPDLDLHCGVGQLISSIKFASFGTPSGTCGSFRQGTCHAPHSHTVLQKECIGQRTCSVAISKTDFGKDPCPNVLKRLSVEAICAPSNQHA